MPETIFPLLADPDRYIACTWELSHDPVGRAHWVRVFRAHIPRVIEDAVREGVDRGEDEGDIRRRGNEFAADFEAWIDQVEVDPTRYEPLGIMDYCIERERLLRTHGFADPYRLAKQSETDRAIELLPLLLEELDTMPDPQRALAVVKGVFAGNIFDLGAVETAELFDDGQTVQFDQVRGKLKPRPWLFDDLDPWIERVTLRPWRSAVLFIDNAGPDIVLGMIPFARDLLQRSVDVLLVANETPTLNDVTIDELRELIDRVVAIDPVVCDAYADGRLELVSSGNGAPLIDLKKVSDTLCKAVRRRDCDLCVLEGMGRAIESNLESPFTCDTLKLAMVKDAGVARELSGELYDLVFRFEPRGDPADLPRRHVDP
jgi:type II pantothenate kinase